MIPVPVPDGALARPVASENMARFMHVGAGPNSTALGHRIVDIGARSQWTGARPRETHWLTFDRVSLTVRNSK
jgi:hypothetical protein